MLQISDKTVAEPSTIHLDCLKKYFGHSEFKPMQWKIIYSLLYEKKDNCAVMATGYGKSLCFQFPAVFSNGSTVVVSPLISLMEDQVLNLKMNNISACYLGSAQTEKYKTWDAIKDGDMRVIYMTPEFITANPDSLLQIPNVILIAIDEAHCVSEWGHDFRPCYRSLSALRGPLPHVPLLAVTATAPLNVIEDISSSLKLRHPIITNTGFDRPNLYLAASIKQDDIMADLRTLMGPDGQFPGSSIVYCPTKVICEKVCEVLSLNHIKNRPYHASLSIKHRKEIHELFVSDQIKVIVATCAFGMGIDKPDVRCIIHYGASKDLSAYYQEIGRAGRDGLNSTCYTFYNSSDFNKNSLLFSSNSSKPEIQRHCAMMMKKVEHYLVLKSCRRKYLLEHFSGSLQNEPETESVKRCCDNCDSNKSSTSLLSCDLDEEVTKFLKVIDLMKGSYGLGAYIKFIRGLGDARITEKMKSSSLFGIGKKQTDAWWKALSRLCVRENLINEKKLGGGGGGGWGKKPGQRPWEKMSVFEVSLLGQFYLERGKNSDIVLTASDEMLQLEKVPREKRVVDGSDAWMSSSGKPCLPQALPHLKPQDVLMKRLQDMRTQLAQQEACLRYMIVTEKQMEEIVVRKPRSPEDLVACGMSEFKIEKYGRQLLEVVYEVCDFKGPNLVMRSQEASSKSELEAASNTSEPSGGENKWEDEAFFEGIDYEQVDKSITQEDKRNHLNNETDLCDDGDAFFEGIDYEQVDKSITQEDKRNHLNNETDLCDDGDAFFENIDYDKLDQSIDLIEKDATSVPITSVNSSRTSELSHFQFESKTLDPEVNLSVHFSKQKNSNSVGRSKLERNSVKESAKSNDPDWDDADDNSFQTMNYEQVEECLQEEQKMCKIKSREDPEKLSSVNFAKKMKLDENLESTSFSSGTKLSSLRKFETSTCKSNTMYSTSASSSTSVPLKSKPKSKLSKFI